MNIAMLKEFELADYYEGVEGTVSIELMIEHWEESEEYCGRPVWIKGTDITDETYYFNGKEISWDDLIKKKGIDEKDLKAMKEEML